jgi:heme iron utilization protein
MSTTNQDLALEKAVEEYQELMRQNLSLQLATCSADGIPEASYSPFVKNENGVFYIYVSEMSAHTANLLDNGKVSVLLIADENKTTQIFARKRVTFQCEATELLRDSAEWEKIINLFSAKFGGVMEHLKTMLDFHMIAMKPTKGRLVLGFGRAYDVFGSKMDCIEHVRGDGGKGHRIEPHSNSDSEKTGLSQEDSDRITAHMNEDHGDAVLRYARHYGKKRDIQSAKLESIDVEAMYIVVDSGEKIRIAFEKPLRNAQGAHMTLVAMAKEARQSLGD